MCLTVIGLGLLIGGASSVNLPMMAFGVLFLLAAFLIYEGDRLEKLDVDRLNAQKETLKTFQKMTDSNTTVKFVEPCKKEPVSVSRDSFFNRLKSSIFGHAVSKNTLEMNGSQSTPK